jgi:hypothetical protein
LAHEAESAISSSMPMHSDAMVTDQAATAPATAEHGLADPFADDALTGTPTAPGPEMPAADAGMAPAAAADDMAAPGPATSGMADDFDAAPAPAPEPEPAPEPAPAPMDDFSSDMQTVDTMDSSLNSLSDDL